MHIQMEITLRCNAKCPACSRHCHYGLYDEESDVTMEQVDRFCEEVKGHGDIDLVSIMGGEPTVHPRLDAIMFRVQQLRDEGSIGRCQVVTNGKLPIPIVFEHRQLDVGGCVIPEDDPLRHQNLRCMFVSPLDTGQELKDCPVAKDCGVSWGAYGWYPCGAGGAIARLFDSTGFRRGNIPACHPLVCEISEVCAHCQAQAKTYMYCRDFGDIQSVSFRKAIAEFDSKRLTRY